MHDAVQTTPPAACEEGPAPDERSGLAARARALCATVWTLILRREVLYVLGALMAIWLLAVLITPDLRPGPFGAAANAPTLVTRAWDMLHPAASWSLRILLATLLPVLLAHFGYGVWPGMAHLEVVGEPWRLNGSDAHALKDGDGPVWRTVVGALGDRRYEAVTISGEGCRQVLLRPQVAERWILYLYPVGLAVAVVAGLALWSGAQRRNTAILLPGDVYELTGTPAMEVRLISLGSEADGPDDARDVAAELQRDGQPWQRARLGSSRWRLRAGAWGRVADVLPGLSVAVHDDAGETLDVQPLTGDRQRVPAYAVIFDEPEEHLLAVPDARIVLRLARLDADAAAPRLVVEALDGGLGTVLGSAFPAEEPELSLEGLTVFAQPESGVVISFWHLPLLWLVIAGLVLAALSGAYRLGHAPWLVWVGTAMTAGDAEWELLVATSTNPLGRRLGERITSALISSGVVQEQVSEAA